MGKYCRQHIGKTFNEGKLIVVDGGDRVGSVKVKCSVCATDSELFGDGIFSSLYFDLVKGQIPCGCSGKTKWTLPQYKIKIERKIKDESLPIVFLEFGAKAEKLAQTSIKLLWVTENIHYTVCSISAFFQGNGNYGSFRNREITLLKYNKLNPNHTVWDSGKMYRGKQLLGFHCKICESMDYESVFTTTTNTLLQGSLPCYCRAQNKQASGSHFYEVSKRLLHEQGFDGVVIGVYKNKHNDWVTTFLCDIHGVYSRAYKSLKSIGCYCPKCSPPNYGYNKAEHGYVYLIDIKIGESFVLGYGITSNVATRMISHKRRLSKIGATITNIQVFEGSGTAVLAVENDIKSLHTTGLLDCEGFRRESISIDMKDKVLEKCKKLKVLDNVDKLI